MVGSLITGMVNHPDDYRKSNISVKGIVIKQSGDQCRVHIFEMDGKPADRLMRMHASGFRILSH
jgi:hypothetical protein